MSAVLLAEFAQAGRMTAAARGAALRQLRVLDAFTPFPVAELEALLPRHTSRIRLVMLLGGLALAALAYATEYYSAVIDYPYNAGGRPLHSWPAFMLVPFALGILSATVAGLAAFLIECGLPRLHHPLFALDGFERASQDRFLLALARPEEGGVAQRTIDWLHQAGALSVREVAT
jgi:ActD protein